MDISLVLNNVPFRGEKSNLSRRPQEIPQNFLEEIKPENGDKKCNFFIYFR